MADALYTLAVLLPVAAAAGAALEAAWESGEKVYGRARRRRNRRAILASLPDVVREAAAREGPGRLAAWHEYVGRELKKGGLKMQPEAFTAVSAGLALAGLAAAYAAAGDAFVAAAAAVMAALLPFSLLNAAVQRRTRKILDELPTAVQLFAVEFEITRSVRESLARSAEAVGEPLKSCLLECSAGLRAGKRPRDVFRKLADDLNSEYGRLWARLLFAATEDAGVVKMVPRLADRLSRQRLLAEKNLADLSGARRVGVILNALIIPGFIAVRLLFPDSSGFFSTPLGRLAVLLVFLSALVGVALDSLLGRVDF